MGTFLGKLAGWIFKGSVSSAPADGDIWAYDSTEDVFEIRTPSAGAPTTADYLVGSAQAGLSAEIVVGTTPGGELGGTWAAPTVDETHSGSAHHADRRSALWSQPHYVAGTGAVLSAQDNAYPVATFADSAAVQDAYFSAPIPTGFTTLQKAVVVVVATTESANLRYNAESNFAANSESRTTGNQTIAATTLALSLALIKEIDVSTLFTGAAAGDYFGMRFRRLGNDAADTITTMIVLGLLIEYT